MTSQIVVVDSVALTAPIQGCVSRWMDDSKYQCGMPGKCLDACGRRVGLCAWNESPAFIKSVDALHRLIIKGLCYGIFYQNVLV